MMTLPMTRIKGVPNREDIIAGMAHFPATGPKGATCGACKHRGYHRQSRKATWSERLQEMIFRTYRVNGCAIFRKLTGRNGPPVWKNNLACRHFEARANDEKR